MYKSCEQIESFFNERKHFGIKLGLGRMKLLLASLNNPQDHIKGIHVAGTNGKGSTIRYLESALIKNSYNVGVFTSPSLTGLTGHIFINGEIIPKEKFINLFNDMYPAISRMDKAGNHPTEFEIITSLAFVYFANNVDIALIETGMGGLEDTTNCFNPILSIITNITQDHTGFLGDTITEIATQKSGIIKPYRPIVIGTMNMEAYAVVEQVASENKVQMHQLNKSFSYSDLKQTQSKQTYTWRYKDELYNMALRMQGEHQVKNSALAMMTLVLLKEMGYMIDIKKSIIAIKNTSLPGRFEVINKNPLIILDGAHNIAGMEAFLQTVKTNSIKQDKHLIFAGFKDKDLKAMLEIVSDYFTTVTFTKFDHPRAEKATILYDLIDIKQKYIAHDWKELISEINNLPLNANAAFFITGSLHFIATVREFLEKENSS